MTPSRTDMAPQLPPRLPEAPAELARALAAAHKADVAEALSRVDPAAAAEVLSAFPLDFAVRVLEHGIRAAPRSLSLLRDRHGRDLYSGHVARPTGPPLPGATTRRPHPLPGRARRGTRATLALLLAYAPTTAGGIMTTDYVSIPPTWTVGETLGHIAQVGRRKPVYAIYVLDPDDHHLIHVVSLRDLVVTDSTTRIMDIGEHRGLLKRRARNPRRALPADLVHHHDPEARRVALRALPRRDAHRNRHAAFRVGAQSGDRARSLHPLIINSGGNSGSQATSLIIRALALREVRVADWWWVAVRELPAGISLGSILGLIGILRIAVWPFLASTTTAPTGHAWP